MDYWIHDKEVFDLLKENRIKFERNGLYSRFTVDRVFDHGQPVKLRGGSLICLGTALHMKTDTAWRSHLEDGDLSRIPGRYIDVYPLEKEGVREALYKNGYTITFVGSDTNHMYYEVNAYIPKDQLSKLPDKTLLLYDFSGGTGIVVVPQKK